jgi:hypothetical protein
MEPDEGAAAGKARGWKDWMLAILTVVGGRAAAKKKTASSLVRAGSEVVAGLAAAGLTGFDI